MKKLICMLLSAALLFLLAGCDQKETEYNYNNNGTFISYVPRYFETKEIITIFARSDLAPVGFIMPDDLSAIGRPEQKVAVYGLYDTFIMFFKDANEVQINIKLRYGVSNKLSKTHLSVTDGMTSMQYLETPKSGFIERCGIWYYYSDGWLKDVSFYVDDIQMSLDIFCTSENPYPEDQQETFYTKLLSLSDEVVLDALRELKEPIYARWGGKERIPSRNWLLPTGIGIGVVALGAIGFVVWKKKKKSKVTIKAEDANLKPEHASE